MDIKDTEMLEEGGVGRTWWTLSAKSHARAMELGMWWLGKFEKIGTLAGHDVLRHTEYIEGVYCCYNVHEECWQIQSPYEVLMVAKDWLWHIDYEVHSCPYTGIKLVLILPDDDEEIVQPKKMPKGPKGQQKKKITLTHTAKLGDIGKGKGKGKDKAKASAECGEWLHMYRALAAAVQTDWAEAQRLVHEVTSDEHGFQASILLMSAILKDNRGDAQAMSSILK